jgi:mannosyltransferase OCH1-like enzyme
MINTIPKIIHLTCKEKKVPSTYVPLLSRLTQMHPDWEIKVYDDNEARQLVMNNFPEMLASFDSYRFPIQRTDIFRVLVVYVHGGFYLDMDMYCLKKLDELCDFKVILGEEKTLSAIECQKLKLKYPLRIGNYMFGSVPGHPFWKEFLNASKEKENSTIISENDILETTGPGLLTNVFHKVKHKFSDIELITNHQLNCRRRCRPTPSCHFGDYAAHLHYGSWRWQNKKEIQRRLEIK